LVTDATYGQIISFYSFKGGVGRSMALANVAALLCKSGKSVLVVDWDLEAPGLHKFFEQSSPGLKEKVGAKPGILDMICGVAKGSQLEWRECAIEVRLGEESLDLISAGRRDSLYGARLQSLQWDRLYEEHDIGQVFEDVREEWKRSYDFVLLDSRTGVTDIGDVCTALLPDLLVIVFVANEQNIEGTKLVIERARTVHGQLPRDRAKLVVIPLLGRDESNTEYELSSTWRARISEQLGFTLSDWLPDGVSPLSYFQKVFIPYYSYWSFGENLPVIQRDEELGNPTSISSAYARLTSLIESGLDWKVLEKGVDSAEINSLRSKASIGEAKSAELEASRLEIEKLEAKRIALEASERLRRAAMRAAAAVVATIVVIVTAVAGLFIWRDARMKEQILIQQKEQIQTQVTAERTASAAAIEAARANADRQLTDLQKQNADLLAKLSETTNHLAKQSTDTQQKLDEILKNTSGSK
jgi:MinD-like ATPase involved in chromosome partitioning or flagellar assembly